MIRFIWLNNALFSSQPICNLIASSFDGIMVNNDEPSEVFYNKHRDTLKNCLHSRNGIENGDKHPEITTKYMGESLSYFDTYYFQKTGKYETVFEAINGRELLTKYNFLADEADPKLLEFYDPYSCSVAYSQYRKFLFSLPIRSGMSTSLRITWPFGNQIPTLNDLKARWGMRMRFVWISLCLNAGDFKSLIDWCAANDCTPLLYADDDGMTESFVLSGIQSYIKLT